MRRFKSNASIYSAKTAGRGLAAGIQTRELERRPGTQAPGMRTRARQGCFKIAEKIVDS